MMKKTLVAAAVLAAVSGAAMAQSSVTLYGVADVYLANTSTTNFVAPGGASVKITQPRVDSGGFSGSRWGLRGVEDLGGGLKATFRFESGFDISTGASAQGGLLFGREAWVGLEGGFGTVRAGRQYTAYDDLYCATDVGYCSSFSPTGGGYNMNSPSATNPLGSGIWGGVGVKNYNGRVNNSISYATPNISGFSGQVVLATNEDKTSNTRAGYNNSLRVQYANGPLRVGYAHQAERTMTPAAGLVPASSARIRYNLVAGTFDFGVAAIQAGYNTTSLAAVRDREYRLGVTVPFGAASMNIGYAAARTQTNGTTTAKGDGFNVAGLYELSKRTNLYAAYNGMRIRSASGADTAKASTIAVGVRHRF